ncbi:MAG: N-acetylmuramoyl-L-alanine amidase [Akkermansiaceae bacterium]|nr:N-acetylmuramoyl-L-alanine amidase [Akkermansiaceae bacterium]
MRLLLHFLALCFLAFLGSGSVVFAAQGKWDITQFNGVEYVNLRDVWKYYQFTPRQGGKRGCLTYGCKDRIISVRPFKQDFYVNNFRYILSYPIQSRADGLYISTIDMKKLVDPVLRPRLTHSARLTTVVLDPGHGGHDAGAKGVYANEKDCNLALALKVRDKLRRAGFKVVMTRDRDFFLTLGERVAIANRTPDCIFVSIHHNSGHGGAEGIETFTLAPHGTSSPFARTRLTEELSGNNQDSENIALATAVHAYAIRRTAAVDRGIQRARFSVLCTINRPAILFEAGFMTHPKEGRSVASPSYQETLAQSICDGILQYRAVARSGSATSSPDRRPPAPRGGSATLGGGRITQH